MDPFTLQLLSLINHVAEVTSVVDESFRVDEKPLDVHDSETLDSMGVNTD